MTDNVNQAKGDKDPTEWVPPLEAFGCTYVKSWIDVKRRYELSADQAEKTALSSLLDSC